MLCAHACPFKATKIHISQCFVDMTDDSRFDLWKHWHSFLDTAAESTFKLFSQCLLGSTIVTDRFHLRFEPLEDSLLTRLHGALQASKFTLNLLSKGFRI